MISFPTDPDIGDSYVFNRIRFVFDSDGWSTTGQPYLVVNEDGAVSFDQGITYGDSASIAQSRGDDQPPLWFNPIVDSASARLGINNSQYMTALRTFQAIGQANVAPVKTALNAGGNPPIYACRAWVSFNGTGTVAIRGSANVSSITDNGLGDYTINFTTPMPDSNYAVVFGATGFTNHPQGVAAIRNGNTPQPGSVRITTGNTGGANSVGQQVDMVTVCVAVFR